MGKTIRDLIMEYFRERPKQDLAHGPVVDWVEEQYLDLYRRKPRDPWRAIRRLHEDGWLMKVRTGVYRYDPDHVAERELRDFTPQMKEAIFRRDNYRCVVCGRGRQDGVEIHADHIRPRDLGGTNTIENGQTLCSQHNLLKKNYSQTEAGKRFAIKTYERAVAVSDESMIRFCKDIFDVYNKYGLNRHIARPNRD